MILQQKRRWIKGATEPDTHNGELKPGKRKRFEWIRLVIPWSVLFASLGLSFLAAHFYVPGALFYLQFSNPYTFHSGSLHIAALLWFTAFVLSAFLIRGPHRRYAFIITAEAFFVFLAQLFVMALIALHAVAQADLDPSILLPVIALSICSLGVVLFVVVTWIRGWPFAEPLTMGLFAISLGAVCLPVLHLLAVPSVILNFNDHGVLYATGPSSQRLGLTVQIDTVDGPTTEAFQINNRGKTPVRWAFLLTGGARLKSVAHDSAHIEDRTIVVGPAFVSFRQTAQLLSGSLSGYSLVTFHGYSFGQFATTVAAQTSVSLPSYEHGNTLTSKASPSIIEALKGEPAYRPVQDSPIVILAGHLPPFDSILEASPSMTPAAGDPTELRWVSHRYASAFYAALNQGAAAVDNNTLFIFAALLGVAGAALIGSLQGAIHILSRRKAA